MIEEAESEKLLEYSVLKLLSLFDEEKEGRMSKTRLNKLLLLLYKNLKEKDVDIRLPYFWYLYGDVVAYDLMPPCFEIVPKGSWEAVLPTKPLPEIGTRAGSIIDREVKRLARRKYQKTAKITKEVYTDAPLNFQRSFKELREALEKRSTVRPLDHYLRDFGEVISFFDVRLDKLLLEFPAERFDDLYPLFASWEGLIRYLLKNVPDEKDLAADLSEYFWRLFAKKLRVEFNENIPEDVVARWVDSYQTNRARFERELYDFKRIFYERHYQPSEKSEKYNKILRPLLTS